MFQPQPSTHPFHRSPFPPPRPHSVGPESRKSFSSDSSGEYPPRKPPPQPLYTRRMTVHFPKEEPDTTYLYGYVLLAGTFIMFVTSMYAIVVSKFVPDTGNKVGEQVLRDSIQGECNSQIIISSSRNVDPGLDQAWRVLLSPCPDLSLLILLFCTLELDGHEVFPSQLTSS